MDKDSWVAENIYPKNKPIVVRKLRNNVKPLELAKATRKTKITFCVLGSWAIYMAPYGLARLSALTRESGYATRVFDFNIESYHDLKEANPALSDAWNAGFYWWWEHKKEYDKRIFPTYEPILKEYLELILRDDPDIVGFSCYYTNKWATFWMIDQIKSRKPNITIIAGGPDCGEANYTKPKNVSYYFVGESEQNILDFLNNWEQGIKPTHEKIGSLYSDTRIDIDSLPYPDYTDYDLAKYWGTNSICAEISRGCIAKCTYCTEVYYWKFRDRGAKNVVDEIHYQVIKHQITFVNFVDSLMNGNLKEFRKFCEDLIDRDLKIGWWGYLRADGRMDYEFYKLMKEAGAKGFNYGIESGSDKVLKAINKKNTVAEINQNLIDADKVGIDTNACLVIGAPGEDTEAFMHTCNMLWNHRGRIAATSPGPGLGDNPGSAYDDRKRFNISEREKPWMSSWYSLDRKNTILHRMVRIKLVHIWVEICRERGLGKIVNVHRQEGDIHDHFKIKFESSDLADHIDYEEFDCQIISSTDHSDFANSLMNEVFSILRLLWRSNGGYEITLNFNWDLNLRDFNFVFPRTDLLYFDATVDFKINAVGEYESDFSFDFKNFDRPNSDESDFVHKGNIKGKWSEVKTVKKNRITVPILEKEKNNTHSTNPYYLMPLEACYSGLSIPSRKFIYQLAKYLPPESSVLELNATIGGISSIIANVNKMVNVVSTFDKFDVRQKLGYEPWINDQLKNEARQNNIDMKKVDLLIDKISKSVEEDPSGRLSYLAILEPFENVRKIDVDDLEFGLLLSDQINIVAPSLDVDHQTIQMINDNKCSMIILNAFNTNEYTYYYDTIVRKCLGKGGVLILPQCHPSLPEAQDFIKSLPESEFKLVQSIDSVTVFTYLPS